MCKCCVTYLLTYLLTYMTTRKISYTKSCKIIEMCGRLKFQKRIPEGNVLNLSCGISERVLLMIKACSIYFISVSKLYRYCRAMYGFVLGLGLVIAKRDFCFEIKTRPSLSYKVLEDFSIHDSSQEQGLYQTNSSQEQDLYQTNSSSLETRDFGLEITSLPRCDRSEKQKTFNDIRLFNRLHIHMHIL